MRGVQVTRGGGRVVSYFCFTLTAFDVMAACGKHGTRGAHGVSHTLRAGWPHDVSQLFFFPRLADTQNGGLGGARTREKGEKKVKCGRGGTARRCMPPTPH